MADKLRLSMECDLLREELLRANLDAEAAKSAAAAQLAALSAEVERLHAACAEERARVAAAEKQSQEVADLANRLVRERAAMEREVERLQSGRVLTCVYCGHAYEPGTPTHGTPVLTAHIKVCEKHPMRALEREVAVLRAVATAVQAHKDALTVWANGGEPPDNGTAEAIYEALAAARASGALKEGTDG